MKRIPETEAIRRLNLRKKALADTVRLDYEHRAKSCLTCETQGECCTDVHFVNVHITRLEAASINRTLAAMPADKQFAIRERIDNTIHAYGLSESGNTFEQKFACPLFENGTGCLIHHEGKPVPCIMHACYERGEDLPPDTLETDATEYVEAINRQTYGIFARWLPLPVWLAKEFDR